MSQLKRHGFHANELYILQRIAYQIDVRIERKKGSARIATNSEARDWLNRMVAQYGESVLTTNEKGLLKKLTKRSRPRRSAARVAQ